MKTFGFTILGLAFVAAVCLGLHAHHMDQVKQHKEEVQKPFYADDFHIEYQDGYAFVYDNSSGDIVDIHKSDYLEEDE